MGYSPWGHKELDMTEALLSTYIYVCVYIHIHTHILLCIFHYGLSQDIEYSSLCYTVRPLLSRDSFSGVFLCCWVIEI